MIIGKEFVEAYADFSEDSVIVEIPFISNAYADDFFKSLTKCYIKAKLKGNFTILATSEVIVGFCYDFGKNESKEYIEQIFEIFSAMIMMEYYNQRDQAEVMEIQFALAA
jgi:hypothetical protein